MTEIIVNKEKKLWVPLHVHSEYSALDGAIRIPRYYEFAQQQELPAAAVTDHFNMSAWAELDRTFKDVKPIFGCELYADSMLKSGPAVAFEGRKRYHLNSYALSKKGLINLQKLVANGYCADNESTAGPYAVTRNGIEEHHEDIVFSSACLSGELSVLLKNGLEDKAKEFVDTICSVVGRENFYIEVLGISYPEQDSVNLLLMDFARKYNIPMLLTTDSHYMPEDVSWYNALLASQKRQSIVDDDTEQDTAQMADRFKKWDVTGQMDLSMRTPEAIWERYGNICPEAITETVRLAERVERFTLKGDKYMLPHIGASSEGFRDKAIRGLNQRFEDNGIFKRDRQDYYSRLDMEINVVESMEFIEYFCLVEDLVVSCRNQGIKVGPGRGSAAGSMLAWSLGITELDPMKFGLLFERFLNPERVSMPDIDIDFEDDRRQEAIDYLKFKYGDSAVVAISNYSRCKWKNGIRDAARVLGAQPWQGDSLVKALEGLIDTTFTSDEDNDFEVEQEITADYLIKYINTGKHKNIAELGEERVKEILELAGHFNGMLRNYGKHASGIVISPGRADDYVPLGRVKGSIATQFNMDDVDYCKLVKVDILGLSTLSMIKEIELESAKFSSKDCITPTMNDFVKFINTCGNLKSEDCANIDIEKSGITQESLKRTFDFFAEGNTTGVFQFASSGMRNLLRRTRPQTIEDLSAAVALYRPGPLASGITAEYIAAGNSYSKGPVKKSFPESMAKEVNAIASDTRGMMIYQEHIMKVARKIAGYSLGEADILRKAIGKKKIEIMEVERAKFVTKAVGNGYPKSDAEQAFDTIEFFAGYGFNKSHSCCYASLAFITAWYAANRAPIFWAALVNDTIKKQRKDIRGQIKIAPILREAGQGMKILAPMILNDFDSSSPDLMRKTRAVLDIDSKLVMGSVTGQKVGITSELWNMERCWTLALGLSAAKGIGKRDSGVQKLLDLGLEGSDTLSTMITKGVLQSGAGSIASAGPLFLNGFFDRILDNSLRARNIFISPIFMRLAIINLGDVEQISPEIKSAMITSCVRFGLRKKDKSDLPFSITKNRSVFGSFLEYAVRRISSQMTRKRSAWTEKDVHAWVSDYFEPIIDLLAKEASSIMVKMSKDYIYRLNAMLRIYRIEKDDFGESLTIPDWGMAAEITGYTFTMFTDEALRYRQGRYDRKYRSGKYKEPLEEGEEDLLLRRLSDEEGFWILGQFISAAWRDNKEGKKSGYISLEGRFGSKERVLYVGVDHKLPFINIDAIKKIQASGGYIALKVKYDFDNNKYYLVHSDSYAHESVNCGFEKMPCSIAVLPMLASSSRKRTVNRGAEEEIGLVILNRDNGIVGRHIRTEAEKIPGRTDTDIERTKFFANLWKEINIQGRPLRIAKTISSNFTFGLIQIILPEDTE